MEGTKCLEWVREWRRRLCGLSEVVIFSPIKCTNTYYCCGKFYSTGEAREDEPLRSLRPSNRGSTSGLCLCVGFWG